MAKRTLRRNPLSVDTDDYKLDEQYANFAEFKGLNTNKNYITVDQNSFEDVKNVYVDQDQQLHTRPPLKGRNNFYKTLQIFKIANAVIYHRYSGNTTDGYFLVVDYNGNTYQTAFGYVYSEVKIINKRGLFIIFTQNSDGTSKQIKAFEILNDEIQYYSFDDIVYIPTTVELRNGNQNDIESSNILTGTYKVRFVLDNQNRSATTDLIGKTVTVTLEDFPGSSWTTTFEFNANDEKVLVKKVNNNFQRQITGNYTFNLAAKIANTDIYVYVTYQTSLSTIQINFNRQYTYTISKPNFNCRDYVLADDGSALYTCDSTNRKFYYCNIVPGDTTYTVSEWNSIEYEYPNNASNNGTYVPPWQMYCSELGSIAIPSTSVVYGHSPETGCCALAYHITAVKRCWMVNTPYFSAGGASFTLNVDCVVLLIYNNGTLKPYIIEQTSLNSGTKERYINKLRLVKTTNLSLLFINSVFTRVNDNGVELGNKLLVLNSNLEPYYYFRIGSESSDTIRYHVEYNMLLNATDNVIAPILGALQNDWDLKLEYSPTEQTYHLSGITHDDNFEIFNIDISNLVLNSAYNASYMSFKITYTEENEAAINNSRLTQTYHVTTESTTSSLQSSSNVTFVKYYNDNNYLTNVYLYSNNTRTEFIRPNTGVSVIPIYVDDQNIVYLTTNEISGTYDGGYLYTSAFSEDLVFEYTVEGDTNLLYPDLLQDFITIVLSIKNNLYWSTDTVNTVTLDDGSTRDIPALYFEKGNIEQMSDDITALTVFSQTSLGVFLQSSVYEFQYNTDNDIYLLTPTKLQLGNLKGSDVLPAYDGTNIFITNVKGLIALTYQDFVQSTEQIYNYLTENIMSNYDEFADGPIKLYQYKDWLFMYKQNNPALYLYDIKNAAWWYWEHPYNIKQLIFNNENLILLDEDGDEFYYDFATTDFLDNETVPINWLVKSQKLHFGAPNNYKHVRQLAIVTSQNIDTLRYKLKFINYHNLQNLVDVDTVEYDIAQLTTMIKRVTFMKLNAFQFVISNDDTDKNPKYFATPNIAIKYRITERVR